MTVVDWLILLSILNFGMIFGMVGLGLQVNRLEREINKRK